MSLSLCCYCSPPSYFTTLHVTLLAQPAQQAVSSLSARMRKIELGSAVRMAEELRPQRAVMPETASCLGSRYPTFDFLLQSPIPDSGRHHDSICLCSPLMTGHYRREVWPKVSWSLLEHVKWTIAVGVICCETRDPRNRSITLSGEADSLFVIRPPSRIHPVAHKRPLLPPCQISIIQAAIQANRRPQRKV